MTFITNPFPALLQVAVRSIWLFLLFTCWLALPVAAQVEPPQEEEPRILDITAEAGSAANMLQKAQKFYEAGQIVLAVDELQKLETTIKGIPLRDAFPGRSELQAFLKLQVLCYLEVGEEQIAEEAMCNLLRLFPTFEPVEELDPQRFIALYKHYRPVSRFQVEIGGGGNMSDVRLLKDYGLSGSVSSDYIAKVIKTYNANFSKDSLEEHGMDTTFAAYSKEKYGRMFRNPGLSWYLSLGIGITPNLYINLNNRIDFQTFSYVSATMQPAIHQQVDSIGNPAIGYESSGAVPDALNPLYRYDFRQRLLFYRPSVSLRFTLPRKVGLISVKNTTGLPIYPYFEAGVGLQLRLGMSRAFETYITPEDNYSALASPPDYYVVVREDKLYHKLQWNNLMGGVGVLVGREIVQFSLGVQAYRAMDNLVNTDQSRYAYGYVTSFLHIDDDIALTNWSGTIGVIYRFSYRVKNIIKDEK